MKVYVNVECKQCKNGIEARSPSLSLASHGTDKKEAMEDLRKGIYIWCKNLLKLGILEDALKRMQLTYELYDQSNIIIELQEKNIYN